MLTELSFECNKEKESLSRYNYLELKGRQGQNSDDGSHGWCGSEGQLITYLAGLRVLLFIKREEKKDGI